MLKTISSAIGPVGPSFSAYPSVTTVIGAAFTPTKIGFQTEQWDTDNAFDPFVNYRFQPTVAGYYEVNGWASINEASFVTVSLYKNSNLFKVLFNTYPVNWGGGGGSALVYLNGSTDYIELYLTTGVAATTVASEYYTYFQAALARRA